MISIIIPTYNHLNDCLKPCLESLFDYTGKSKEIGGGAIPVEVIVSANGCTDGTKTYLNKLKKKYKSLKVVWNDKPLGYSRANNEALKVANGDYIVLLNNDTILLPQKTNDWLNILIAPFKTDPKMGITGPIYGYSGPADRKFVVFFCAMIRKQVFDDIGYLDPIFGVGGGEDTDFCIRAENAGWKLKQVPGENRYDENKKLLIGAFPIYHKGEATVNDNPKWQEIFNRNSVILTERWNRKWKLSNRFERAVIGREDFVPPREDARYKWAAENLIGNKVLEIGCSSGYGTRYLKGVDYLGIDYDKAVIEYAREQFPEYRFQVADITTFPFEQYDTIIAFEVLEHLEKGREIAQSLKKHCKCLLITTPWDEKPGQWGPHHKLHHLTKDDFPGFEWKYITVDGKIADTPQGDLSLLLGKWTVNTPNGLPAPAKQELGLRPQLPSVGGVTAVVCTRNRYDSTLSLCLSAIVNQSHKVKEIIVYDDSDPKVDIRNIPHYDAILRMISKRGIEWKVEFVNSGQVNSHRRSLKDAKWEYIWRVDDDEVPEHDCLEKLMSVMGEEVGAVGGLVLDPRNSMSYSTIASNKIEDIYLGMNEQWFKPGEPFIKNDAEVVNGWQGPRDVDHLYSTFVYKKGICKPEWYANLSRIGHREETIFTYNIRRAGFRVILNPKAITWHFRAPSGGIRDGKHEMWAQDELIFQEMLEKWGIKPKKHKVIVLDNGIGDHYVFKKVLPEVRKRYPELILAVCFPDVFRDSDVRLISIAEAQSIGKTEGVYQFMHDRNWGGSLEEAYKAMYLS